MAAQKSGSTAEHGKAVILEAAAFPWKQPPCPPCLCSGLYRWNRRCSSNSSPVLRALCRWNDYRRVWVLFHYVIYLLAPSVSSSVNGNNVYSNLICLLWGLNAIRQLSSLGADFACQKIFGNVWRRFWCPNVSALGWRGCNRHPVGRGQGCCCRSHKAQDNPTQQSYLVWCAVSAEAEKLCSKAGKVLNYVERNVIAVALILLRSCFLPGQRMCFLLLLERKFILASWSEIPECYSKAQKLTEKGAVYIWQYS